MNPDSKASSRATRLSLPQSETHLYKVGQAVRLKGGFSRTAEVYRVNAQLPPSGRTPQYRIQNSKEGFERVATEDKLEPAHATRGDESASLIEKAFGLPRG